MITSAITAVITAILAYFGIPPGPYVAGIWIAVKIAMISIIALVGWRAVKRRQQKADAAATTVIGASKAGDTPAAPPPGPPVSG